ncbi:lipoprotein [Fibrobacter succinogenes]|uniref:lipoprotein n=1 Tax=Fibrobacter succinogenes TaxID=833 RepID=UPI001569E50B|nr:lipoprotein [Fibrobacter succinogenes]
MKKILSISLIFAVLVLSGCAILTGTRMRPIVLGQMLIYVRVSTANAFIATEMPEKLEIDTPFNVNLPFSYKNAVHDTTKGIASVTLNNDDLEMGFILASYSKAVQNNPEIFQNDISDSLKTTRIFTAYDGFFKDCTKENLVDTDYNSEKKYTHRCYKITHDDGTPEDICLASRLTPKGNIVLVFMRSLTFGTNVRTELFDAIESIEFKD